VTATTANQTGEWVVSEATRLSILVIDDDSQLRGFLREVLLDEGYQVLEAANGSEGASLYEQYRPDLVLTDIVMPEKEGIELIMELRRKAPGLPIIAMSGGNAGFSGSYLSAAGKLGANVTLAKPFTANHLLGAISDLLQQSSAMGCDGASS
jgi:DNA-binding response OmpR family regulator